jgi:2-keto-4-pentenoate hydratase/2-oxohepta-3-ene-1,7-dioic acid hydratase in catechol pathway
MGPISPARSAAETTLMPGMAIGTGTEKGAVFGREAGTRRRLQDDECGECPSSARGCLNAE